VQQSGDASIIKSIFKTENKHTRYFCK